MMKKMYRVSFGEDIKEHEVVQETPKKLTYLSTGFSGNVYQNLEFKKSENYAWFNTWEEARLFVLGVQKEKLNRFLDLADDRKNAIKLIEEMKNPYE